MRYDKLTPAHRDVLLCARSDGAEWVVMNPDGFLYGFSEHPVMKAGGIWGCDGFSLSWGKTWKFPPEMKLPTSECIHVPTALTQIAEQAPLTNQDVWLEKLKDVDFLVAHEMPEGDNWYIPSDGKGSTDDIKKARARQRAWYLAEASKK